MTRDYLTVVDILAIHAVLLRRYGGADGVRDIGALEAAVSWLSSFFLTALYCKKDCCWKVWPGSIRNTARAAKNGKPCRRKPGSWEKDSG